MEESECACDLSQLMLLTLPQKGRVEAAVATFSVLLFLCRRQGKKKTSQQR